MRNPSTRLYLVGFLTCTGLMLCALYFEHFMGLNPCPLCMFQRVFVVAVGLVCLVGFLHNPGITGHRVYAGFVLVFSLAGAAIAGRQVWLQGLPADQVPACGPDLDFMLQAFPLLETISTVLSGSGECAEIQWSFLGMSMPTWMVFIFGAMCLVALQQMFKARPSIFS
jgi:protein dithiol:quinone oxidoreductase